MPFIEKNQKARNPIKYLPKVGLQLHVWTPRRPAQPYSTRTFTLIQTTNFKTNEIWGDFPKDKNCSWTRDTVVIGRGLEGRNPFVGYSFLSSLPEAIAEFEKIQEFIAGLPKADSPLLATVVKLEALEKAAGQLAPVDGLVDLPRSERAEKLRQFLKEHQIEGVSVTTPEYARATAVEIRFPQPIEEDERSLKDRAYKALTAILKQVFPKNQDRPDSDPFSDHFGYLAWSIH